MSWIHVGDHWIDHPDRKAFFLHGLLTGQANPFYHDSDLKLIPLQEWKERKWSFQYLDLLTLEFKK